MLVQIKVTGNVQITLKNNIKNDNKNVKMLSCLHQTKTAAICVLSGCQE